MRGARWIAVAALSALAGGCVDYLDPGEFGPLRYFGEVRGEAPVRMLPPISDREGNVYALYGDPERGEARAFVGHAGGGWAELCNLHEGDDRGVHGWIGRNDDRAWYWSGDALVEVSGRTGECLSLVDRDPASGADLQFLGVVPWVDDPPSRTTVPALIQSAADVEPYHVLIDLDRDRYTNLRPFEPRDAEDVSVLGVGADPDAGVGYMLVTYRLEGRMLAEALYLDVDGRVTDRVPIPGAQELPRDAVAGYLQSNGSVVAGLLHTGELVLFANNGGQLRTVSSMEPVGVHRWDGGLWLVGTAADRPAIAPIDDRGEIGAPIVWTASLRASEFLESNPVILDDRDDPMRRVDWTAPRSALGAYPFLHPHTPHQYALDTTAWLVAGPSHDAGGDRRTAVAFGPVGISYP